MHKDNYRCQIKYKPCTLVTVRRGNFLGVDIWPKTWLLRGKQLQGDLCKSSLDQGTSSIWSPGTGQEPGMLEEQGRWSLIGKVSAVLNEDFYFGHTVRHMGP